MTLRVVVTDSDLGRDDIEANALGPDVELDFADARTPEQVIAASTDADGLLVQWAHVDSSVFAALPRLRAIVRYGIGLDTIDLDAARAANVAVSNVPDYCIDEVADHAAAMVIAGSRRLHDYDRAVRRGDWATRPVSPPLPMDEDPVGIAGFGRIGQAVARRLLALGFPVHVFDPLLTTSELPVTVHEDLPSLAAACRHLSLHMPAIAETIGICNAEVLSALGNDGHLVNTSRGALVDEPALVTALNNGTLRWASLDVVSVEPPTTGTARLLAEHPRVTMTPHVAYLSTVSPDRLRRRAAERLADLLRGH